MEQFKVLPKKINLDRNLKPEDVVKIFWLKGESKGFYDWCKLSTAKKLLRKDKYLLYLVE